MKKKHLYLHKQAGRKKWKAPCQKVKGYVRFSAHGGVNQNMSVEDRASVVFFLHITRQKKHFYLHYLKLINKPYIYSLVSYKYCSMGSCKKWILITCVTRAVIHQSFLWLLDIQLWWFMQTVSVCFHSDPLNLFICYTLIARAGRMFMRVIWGNDTPHTDAVFTPAQSW